LSRLEPLVELLDRLENVKKASPTRYRAKCPVHQRKNSKNRTLAIFENENGSVGFHCHAGCQCDEILFAVDLQPSDLFPHDEWMEKQRKEGKPTGPQLRSVIERARGATTLVEVGARMLSRGETLDADDLILLAGASADLRGMLDV